MLLKIRDLKSGYRNIPVVEEINIEIHSGQIVGLIGLNGAGKSTLLKTILGLIQPIAGKIEVLGETFTSKAQAYASQIAYIPETPVLYDELTLQEHLEMTALGYQIPLELVMERSMPLLKLFRLDKHLNWYPIHFSKGMKQKVMIVCALVTDAKLLIIDEPFLGLDPLAINHFKQLMQKKAQEGCGIIFTTHVLTIAEQLCDKYLFLQKGKIVGDGQLADLQRQFNMPNATLDDLYIEMTVTEHA